MWQRRRYAYDFVSGGPGSGLYKSSDGGKTWKKLTKGIPAGPLGRIGFSYYRKNPNIVYARIEHETESGVYRSDNGGATWRKMSSNNPRPMYFGVIKIDPQTDSRIYVPGVDLTISDDGGRTFRTSGAEKIHVDHHALWINPKDSKHMLLGYDHGMTITFDGGAHWYHPDNLAAAQCMGIGFDMAQPYNVYCGLQDNGSKKGPSSMKGGGTIPFEAWQNTGGGDGQQNIVELENSRYLYNESQFGALSRTDMVTGQTKGYGGNGRGAGAGQWTDNSEIRWNWNAPIIVSPHSSDTASIGICRRCSRRRRTARRSARPARRRTGSGAGAAARSQSFQSCPLDDRRTHHHRRCRPCGCHAHRWFRPLLQDAHRGRDAARCAGRARRDLPRPPGSVVLRAREPQLRRGRRDRRLQLAAVGAPAGCAAPFRPARLLSRPRGKTAPADRTLGGDGDRALKRLPRG